MSRKQFEALIRGRWTRLPNGRRQSGKFTTRLRRTPSGTFKEVSDGTSTIWARTWRELAEQLGLV